jgi:hypothetical protein
MSTDEELCTAPEMTRLWWRRLSLQPKIFGFTPNRYVISDMQPEKLHSLNEASPPRVFLVHGLIHGLITMLLVVFAVGIGWFW